MNSIYYLILLLTSLSLNAGTIKLDVSGLETFNKQIAIAIFEEKNAHDFPANGESAIYRDFVLSDGSPIHIDVPSDKKYAITVFLDENLDQKLNTNFLGIPTEPIGFSNNPKLIFGAPSFMKASFLVKSSVISKKIILKSYL